MTAARVRLDAELVRRGLARSREQAGELVAAGRVTVAGQRAAKAATQVTRDAPISIADAGEPGYVSRGGHKLAGALAVFGPEGLVVAGRACLDAGASTGGFTDVLLRAGAAHVVAADVGYGQLAWSLRTDPRVTVLDRVNVRTLDRVEDYPGARARGGGPLLHLAHPGAPGPGGLRRAGRGFRPAGEAAVRGG